MQSLPLSTPQPTPPRQPWTPFFTTVLINRPLCEVLTSGTGERGSVTGLPGGPAAANAGRVVFHMVPGRYRDPCPGLACFSAQNTVDLYGAGNLAPSSGQVQDSCSGGSAQVGATIAVLATTLAEHRCDHSLCPHLWAAFLLEAPGHDLNRFISSFTRGIYLASLLRLLRFTISSSKK